MIKQLNYSKCLILEVCSVPGLCDGMNLVGWFPRSDSPLPCVAHPAILVDLCGFQKDTELTCA